MHYASTMQGTAILDLGGRPRGVVLGWGLAQFPYVVPPDLHIVAK